jgi:hypothetical protein
MPVFQVRLSLAPGEPADLGFVAKKLWAAILHLTSSYRGTICAALPDVPMTPKSDMLGTTGQLSYPFDPDLPNASALRAAASLLFSAHLDGMTQVTGTNGWLIDEPLDDLPAVLQAETGALGEHEPLLGMIRPDPHFAEKMSSFLRSQEPNAVAAVAWYLAATAGPPADLVAQLFGACVTVRDPAATAQTRKALRLLAPRIQLGELMDAHLSSKDPVALVLALELLEDAVQRGRLPPAWRLGPLYEALRLGGIASEVAAEKLALAVDKEDPGQFRRACEALREFLAGRLSQDPDMSQDARHNAVLSLVNLILDRPAVPQCVVDALHAQNDAPEPVAGLARWALKMIEGRPVERW